MMKSVWRSEGGQTARYLQKQNIAVCVDRETVGNIRNETSSSYDSRVPATLWYAY